MPAAPKVTSRALSSNSPTMLGAMPRRSNHWSMRALTAACAVGNSTGSLASDCGKPSRAAASNASGAYQASGDAPNGWL